MNNDRDFHDELAGRKRGRGTARVYSGVAHLGERVTFLPHLTEWQATVVNDSDEKFKRYRTRVREERMRQMTSKVITRRENVNEKIEWSWERSWDVKSSLKIKKKNIKNSKKIHLEKYRYIFYGFCIIYNDEHLVFMTTKTKFLNRSTLLTDCFEIWIDIVKQYIFNRNTFTNFKRVCSGKVFWNHCTFSPYHVTF